MKKLVVCIFAIICLSFCTCASNSTDTILEKDKKGTSNTSPVSPISFMEFNSFDELEKALNSHTEDILLSYFIDCGVGNEQVETIRAMAKAIQLHNNIVPYIDGKRIELRSEEGFSNITMYSSEKYGLPCIFYHPTVSNGENLYIALTCIPSDLLRNQELSTASDLVKIMSPGYPNIDNFGKQCKAVYNKKVRLRDQDVTAMIYEYNADKRDSTIFLYENLLVEVRNDPEIWGTDWFSTLSFGGF